MKILSLIRAAAITLILFAVTTARADEPPKSGPADREAVLAKLKANGVNLNGLTAPKSPPPVGPTWRG